MICILLVFKTLSLSFKKEEDKTFTYTPCLKLFCQLCFFWKCFLSPFGLEYKTGHAPTLLVLPSFFPALPFSFLKAIKLCTHLQRWFLSSFESSSSLILYKAKSYVPTYIASFAIFCKRKEKQTKNTTPTHTVLVLPLFVSFSSIPLYPWTKQTKIPSQI